MSMILGLLGAVSGKVWAYLGMALAGVAVLWGVRQSGVNAEKVDQLEAGAKDQAKADTAAAKVAALGSSDVVTQLHRDYERKP